MNLPNKVRLQMEKIAVLRREKQQLINNKEKELEKIKNRFEKKIEKLDEKILNEQIKLDELLEKFNNDELKKAVLKNITDDILTIYKQGGFEDLCLGPHLPNTKMIKNFKLIRVAGAYLGGNEENEMITRIYGISFFDKIKLKEHIIMLEEAKKRDHRRLGIDLKLWTFSDDKKEFDRNKNLIIRKYQKHYNCSYQCIKSFQRTC